MEKKAIPWTSTAKSKFQIFYLVFSIHRVDVESDCGRPHRFRPNDVQLRKPNRTEIAPKFQTINPPVPALYATTDRRIRHVIGTRKYSLLIVTGAGGMLQKLTVDEYK